MIRKYQDHGKGLMMSDTFKETLKEWARTFLLSLAGTFIGFILPVISINPENFDTKAFITAGVSALVAAITATLRAIDKWLHEKGKETGNEALIKGLTRF